MSDPKILVALDYDNQAQALELVDKLKPELCGLKVGKEMFTLFGPEFVKVLVSKGFKVFLDLKFHDIPNTVAKACKAAAELGVWMVNVHASGGSKMMHAARQAIEECDNRPLLIAVTLLTSMDEVAYSEIGFKRDLPEQVEHLASISKSAGLDGVVCSAWEAKRLKEQLGQDFKLVTPGIRPPGSDIGDQSRIMTPEQAVVAGSDYLVIGRPITKASDPLKALYDISESIVS
ncbi:orotidine-5'-phosphate decarboxylase [Kangiella koreensis]|uniref:Orotidine 5'-phosphate decarboxylase n=1 Tax=Kangiella koreensis (strain DSM 16069 / JCM 12317 / KCTC 12182 / SW-125) TaxID=523791 RepID=C7RAN0_KANKD|nr:orotidine-5'-phosphate decarboxylase [Kangiella koreensis]ACV26322.1 orotidine 5'-phosphate decarboxylase [Kangiella koreensis DSM 16069]